MYSIGRDTKFTVLFHSFTFYVALRISQLGLYTDQREILHSGSDKYSPIVGIAPQMAEFWASTGAIWRDMLLAEALVETLVDNNRARHISQVSTRCGVIIVKL